MFHKDGYKFIIIAWSIVFISSYFSIYSATFIIPIPAFVMYFFRNPKRYPLLDKDVILSPAEGKIVDISNVNPPKDFNFKNDKCTKISIFLNVFDVHVNAIPIDSKVIDIIYHKGKFFNASLDKASIHNERNTVILEYNKNKKLAVTQVAGLIARRIRCDLKKGDKVKKGNRFGIIRFGSRVDIHFDGIIKPLVAKGQRVRMLETVLYKIS